MMSADRPMPPTSRQLAATVALEEHIASAVRTEVQQVDRNRKSIEESEKKIGELQILLADLHETSSLPERKQAREANWLPPVIMFGQFWIFGIFLTDSMALWTYGVRLGWSAGALGLVVAILMFRYVSQNQMFKGKSFLSPSGSSS